MKFLLIILCLIFLIWGIDNNNLSSIRDNLKEERKESFEACKRIKNKAPNLNLKCEHLLDDNAKNEENIQKDKFENTEIKTLTTGETNTRKVNKSEEIKLRNLIQALSNGKKLRKD